MNGNTDFDRIAQSWLQDGPTEMPDRSLQAALDEVHVTSQRRFGAARRVIPMNGNTPRVAAAAVIGLLVLVVGLIYLGGARAVSAANRPPRRRRHPAPTPPRPEPTAPPDRHRRSPCLGSLGPECRPPSDSSRCASHDAGGRGRST